MNKAFTANINNQVTARGYLDENNQLIMLEPEGSGGGSELFELVTLTIVGDGPSPAIVAHAACYFEEEDAVSVGVLEQLEAGTYKIIKPVNGSSWLYISGSASAFELSGDITYEGSGNFYEITGDCTITFSE